MRFLTGNIALLIICVFTLNLKAQNPDYPFVIEKYNFIHYDQNDIEYKGKAYESYKIFFQKLNKLILQGEGQVHIVHIGDSHLQADYFSGEMRKRLQTFSKSTKGARGFVFPYRVAKTNNPVNYRVTYTGNWERCRNVGKKNRYEACELGVAGINVKTYDSLSSMSFSFNTEDYPVYDFNRIKVFYNLNECPYHIEVENYNDALEVFTNYNLGYTEFRFNKHMDSLSLRFIKMDSLDLPFRFYGISFENDDPGIIYSTIGVNGAEVGSYLKTDYFREHLKALDPDLVIISLGTNDAYMKRFPQTTFEKNYDTLIQWVREAKKDVPLLLTTPGDSYRSYRYLNYNMAKAGSSIKKTAEKHDAAVWDFYNIMGGLNSVSLWYRSGLTARDKLHFNKYGYILQGDLFFNAFLKAYDGYIDKQMKTKQIRP